MSSLRVIEPAGGAVFLALLLAFVPAAILLCYFAPQWHIAIVMRGRRRCCRWPALFTMFELVAIALRFIFLPAKIGNG